MAFGTVRGCDADSKGHKTWQTSISWTEHTQKMFSLKFLIVNFSLTMAKSSKLSMAKKFLLKNIEFCYIFQTMGKGDWGG